jgi:hypothetical protein
MPEAPEDPKGEALRRAIADAAAKRLASEPDSRSDRVERLESSLMDQAIAWVENHWGDRRPCPYCGNVYWEIGPPGEFSRYLASGDVLVFPITCSNCGQMVLLNGAAMGFGTDSDGDAE